MPTHRHSTSPAKKGEATSRPGSRHEPQAPARKGGTRATHVPSHTHNQPRNPHANTCTANPKPKKAREGHNPYPYAQTASPGQELRREGEDPNTSTHQNNPNQEGPENGKPQTQAHAPHNSRKPSSHSPDTEAARAMQVTRPNEIRSPGLRLHPKACAALGLEAERATPKHLGTQVPRRRR